MDQHSGAASKSSLVEAWESQPRQCGLPVHKFLEVDQLIPFIEAVFEFLTDMETCSEEIKARMKSCERLGLDTVQFSRSRKKKALPFSS